MLQLLVAQGLISVTSTLEVMGGKNPLTRDTATVTSACPKFASIRFTQIPIYRPE